MTAASAGIRRPDDIYAALIAMHEGKTEEESLKLWAKLTLLLIGEVGNDAAVLRAISAASSSQAPKA